MSCKKRIKKKIAEKFRKKLEEAEFVTPYNSGSVIIDSIKKRDNLVRNSFKNIDMGAKASIRYTGMKLPTLLKTIQPVSGDQVLLDKSEK